MATFAQIIKKKQKDWDAPHLMDGARAPRSAKLPFSSPLVNYCTYGGIPRNKITTFYGEYSGGKSTSAIDICKNAYKIFVQEYEAEVAELREQIANGKKQLKGPLEDLLDRGPMKILYLDLEHSFDEEWAATLGIKPEEIEIMQPPDIPAEDLLDTLQEIIETGEVGIIVLDSIPSLTAKQELEKSYGDKTVAAIAGPLTRFMRKIPPVLTRYKCTLLLINQLRPDMNNPYADNMPGGEAVKYYSSLMMKFHISDPVDILGQPLKKSAENPAGFIIEARITKQKSAPNNRRVGTYYLISDQGIREDFDFANMAINQYGIIQKSGGWYTMCNPFTGEPMEEDDGRLVKVNGLAKVYSFLKDNTDYYDKLKTFILNDINGVEQPTDELSDEGIVEEEAPDAVAEILESSEEEETTSNTKDKKSTKNLLQDFTSVQGESNEAK